MRRRPGGYRVGRAGQARGSAAVQWTGVLATCAVLSLSLLVAARSNASALTGKASCVISMVTEADGGECETRRTPSREPLTANAIPRPQAHGSSPGAAVSVPGSSATFHPSDVDDPNNVWLKGSFWDLPCGAGTDDPECAASGPIYPGLAVPRCEGGPLPTPLVGRDPGLAPDPKRESTFVRAVDQAQNYYCRRFGWRGFDGVGNTPVTVHANNPFRNAVAAFPSTIRFHNSLADESPYLEAIAAHEYAHLVWFQLLPGLDYSTTTAAGYQTGIILEAFAGMQEMEIRGNDQIGNLAVPLVPIAPQAFTCPKETTAWNGYPLVAAFSDIAYETGTVVFTAGEDADVDGKAGRLDPAWDRIAALRWAAMSQHLPTSSQDGTLTFGEVRAAFVAAAADVGLDPGIVSRAFDRHGITSDDWTPPACDWSP